MQIACHLDSHISFVIAGQDYLECYSHDYFFDLKLFSATSYPKSFTHYFINTTYHVVPYCCSGYVGAPPDCQGM